MQVLPLAQQAGAVLPAVHATPSPSVHAPESTDPASCTPESVTPASAVVLRRHVPDVHAYPAQQSAVVEQTARLP